MTTRALTDSETLALESALLDRRRHGNRLFLFLALGSGFRVSELLSLQWPHLLSPAGDVARDVTIERGMRKGGAGLRRKPEIAGQLAPFPSERDPKSAAIRV